MGALGLAGRRAPSELRAFMLTLAVVDDLGTIAVIALFFGDDVSLVWLAASIAVVGVIIAAQRIGIRSLVAYVMLAAALWLAVFESGIHATIAGVTLGFLTPAVAFQPRDALAAVLGKRSDDITRSDREVSEGTLLDTSRLTAEAVAPLTRMEERLHPWSAYAILPLFALANSGVSVSLDAIADSLTGPIGVGVALGLVVGAPLGGFLFALAIVRLGPGRLPQGLDWSAIAGVTPLKGIGFTIAIFISGLAFDDAATQEQAKLAILVGSVVAAVIGVAVLVARDMATRQRTQRLQSPGSP